VWRCGLNSTGSKQCPVAGYCERGSEFLNSQQMGNFLISRMNIRFWKDFCLQVVTKQNCYHVTSLDRPARYFFGMFPLFPVSDILDGGNRKGMTYYASDINCLMMYWVLGLLHTGSWFLILISSYLLTLLCILGTKLMKWTHKGEVTAAYQFSVFVCEVTQQILL
jgi:hypothetical protein